MQGSPYIKSVVATMLALVALTLFSGESRSQQFTGTGNLDSIACVIAERNVARALENRGIRMDSVCLLLPTILKVHWPISTPNSTSRNVIVTVSDVHGRFSPARTKNGLEGILRVKGELNVWRRPPDFADTKAISFESLQRSAPDRAVFGDSAIVTMDDGQSIGDISGRKFDLVQVVPEVPSGIWESTLEPALVIIGGAVIVALFFLIRS